MNFFDEEAGKSGSEHGDDDEDDGDNEIFDEITSRSDPRIKYWFEKLLYEKIIKKKIVKGKLLTEELKKPPKSSEFVYNFNDKKYEDTVVDSMKRMKTNKQKLKEEIVHIKSFKSSLERNFHPIKHFQLLILREIGQVIGVHFEKALKKLTNDDDENDLINSWSKLEDATVENPYVTTDDTSKYRTVDIPLPDGYFKTNYSKFYYVYNSDASDACYWFLTHSSSQLAYNIKSTDPSCSTMIIEEFMLNPSKIEHSKPFLLLMLWKFCSRKPDSNIPILRIQVLSRSQNIFKITLITYIIHFNSGYSAGLSVSTLHN